MCQLSYESLTLIFKFRTSYQELQRICLRIRNFQINFFRKWKKIYANWIIKSEELIQFWRFRWNQNESKIQWHLFFDLNRIFNISFSQKVTDICDWYHSDQFLIWRILCDTIFGIINTSKMFWYKPCWVYRFNSQWHTKRPLQVIVVFGQISK